MSDHFQTAAPFGDDSNHSPTVDDVLLRTPVPAHHLANLSGLNPTAVSRGIEIGVLNPVKHAQTTNGKWVDHYLPSEALLYKSALKTLRQLKRTDLLNHATVLL